MRARQPRPPHRGRPPESGLADSPAVGLSPRQWLRAPSRPNHARGTCDWRVPRFGCRQRARNDRGISNESVHTSEYRSGLRDICGGGLFNALPGQVTSDTELALALARALVVAGCDFDAIAESYVSWLASGPFDDRRHYRESLARRQGQGQRSSPVDVGGVSEWLRLPGERRPHREWRHSASMRRTCCLNRRTNSLAPMHASHTLREVCEDASAAHVVMIAAGAGPTIGYARQLALTMARTTEVKAVLDNWGATAPAYDGANQRWVLVALGNALARFTALESPQRTPLRTGASHDPSSTVSRQAAIPTPTQRSPEPLRRLPWCRGNSATVAQRGVGCPTDRGWRYQCRDIPTLARLLEARPSRRHQSSDYMKRGVTAERHYTNTGPQWLTLDPGAQPPGLEASSDGHWVKLRRDCRRGERRPLGRHPL